MAPEDVQLRFHGVSKRYGATVALEPTDLAVARGATTVLVGESGSGKSTLLRLAIGLVAPDQGRVTVGGVVVGPATVREIRRRTGYVIQEGGLFPHLTVRGNASLLARRLGWSRERIEARLLELCRLTRLEPALLDRFPRELSGGQRQRVSLMRALVLEPEVLLLDEPFAALDPATRVALQEEVAEIVRGLGATVLLVTHDLPEAVLFGQELVVLHAGRVLQRGSPAEIVDAPADERVAELVAAARRQHRRLEEVGS